MSTPPPYRPRYQVAPPPPTVRRYTLLSAAQVLDEPGDLWQEGVEYTTDSCNTKTGYVDGWCPDGDFDKDVDSYAPALVTADPFTITSGIVCQSPVFAALDKSRTVLALGEDIQVEQRFWAQQMARPDLRVLTKDKPMALDDAIGLIEQDAALRYAGQLYLHIPVKGLDWMRRQYIAAASSALWRTNYGSLVVPGSGYADGTGPGGTPAPDGTWWVLATGQVQVRRSEVFAHEAFDYKVNKRGGMAERTYVITGDCYAAAALVAPCGCSETPTDGGAP